MPAKKKGGKGKSKGKSKGKKKESNLHVASDFPLTESEISNIKKTFTALAKGKGAVAHIKLDQLAFVMRASGGVPSEEEIKAVTDDLISKEKALIYFNDFLEILAEHRKKHGFLDQELSEAFETLDEDCNGYIETKELIRLLTMLGDPLNEKEAEELIKEADLNNDGKVDYIEFVAMTSKV